MDNVTKEVLEKTTKKNSEFTYEVDMEKLNEEVAKQFSKLVDEEVSKNPNLVKLNEINKSENIDDFDLEIRENEMSDTALKELVDKEKDEQPNNTYTPVFNSKQLDSLDDSELLVLFDIMNKYNNDNSFDVYGALPEGLKNIIKIQLASMGVTGKKNIKYFTVMLIEQMVADIKMDKEFKLFQDELEAALKIPDLIDMYAEHTRDLMEVKLIEKAESIKEVNEEKHKELINISKAYTDSYTFVRQKEFIENNKQKVFAHMAKNTNKKFNRFCEDFDFKMSKTSFKTHKVEEIVPVLKSLFNIDDQLARGYVVVLCQLCENYDRTKMEDVWFMYSSVRNIVSLKFSGDNKTEFSKLIINNVKDFLKMLCNDYSKFREV